MDRASMKEHAKEQIRGKIFTLLAMNLVVIAVGWVASFILGPVSWILTLLISGPISYTWAVVFLGITNKSRLPLFDDLLVGFKGDNFLRNFIAYLRYAIFTFLWSLLFVIPGIIKSIAYSQMFYFLAEDDEMDAAEAQSKSMEVMEGHKWEYFMLLLSFIPWYLLGMITFGIAFIWVVPYINTTMAEFHVRLTGGHKDSSKSVKKAVTAKTTATKTTAAKATTTKTTAAKAAVAKTSKTKKADAKKATKTKTAKKK